LKAYFQHSKILQGEKKMSDLIKDPTIIAALQDLAHGVKSGQELAALTQNLLKITAEASLNAELDDHLGYLNSYNKCNAS
jgi:hypothetical protein